MSPFIPKDFFEMLTGYRVCLSSAQEIWKRRSAWGNYRGCTGKITKQKSGKVRPSPLQTHEAKPYKTKDPTATASSVMGDLLPPRTSHRRRHLHHQKNRPRTTTRHRTVPPLLKATRHLQLRSQNHHRGGRAQSEELAHREKPSFTPPGAQPHQIATVHNQAPQELSIPGG